MAKYLGGIKDQNIEVIGVSQHFFSPDFNIEYYDYTSDSLTVQKKSIAQSVTQYEEVTAENYASSDNKKSNINNSLTGGLAGYLAGGPVWGIIGAALANADAAKEKHVIFCELDNGWQFVVELDKNEFKAWQSSMDGKRNRVPLNES